MPRKKKTVEVVVKPEVTEEPVEEKPRTFTSNEPMVLVLANGSFHDGAFKHDLALYGYGVHWKDQEVRKIPARLYVKLMQRSGGRFSLKG